MPKTRKCNHTEWIYERKSCCYILRCANLDCALTTTAYYVKGKRPNVGDRVKLDGEIMEIVEGKNQ